MTLLPTSREATAVDGVPLAAAVINAIQDAIIGAKMASNRVIVPAAAWTVRSGAPTYANGAWTVPTSPAATHILTAEIRLLVGTRITAIEWGVNAPGSTASRLSLRKIPIIGTGGAVDQARVDPTLGAFPPAATKFILNAGSVTTGTLPYQTEDDMTLWLEAQFGTPGAVLSFFGATIVSDRL